MESKKTSSTQLPALNTCISKRSFIHLECTVPLAYMIFCESCHRHSVIPDHGAPKPCTTSILLFYQVSAAKVSPFPARWTEQEPTKVAGKLNLWRIIISYSTPFWNNLQCKYVTERSASHQTTVSYKFPVFIQRMTLSKDMFRTVSPNYKGILLNLRLRRKWRSWWGLLESVKKKNWGD